MTESTLNAALRTLEATEANLNKAERLFDSLLEAIPDGIAFVDDPDYEDNLRDLQVLLETLPKISSWKPDFPLFTLTEVAQLRFDAQELGDFEATVSIDETIKSPRRNLREYRRRLQRKRRQLVREALTRTIQDIDSELALLTNSLDPQQDSKKKIAPELKRLESLVTQIGMLLGSNIPRRWGDLHRHLSFAMLGDLYDIVEHDWPAIKASICQTMHGENEPVAVDVQDIGELVGTVPRGEIATRLKWESLSATDFERVIFCLITAATGYENPRWLMHTNAPDRGRDLSAFQITQDPFGGTLRQRVIIQCKHWLSKSVSVGDVALLKEQMRLWQPPRVDICVIATTGRFTADAVAAIECHNQSDSALRIDMWAESQLELLLAGYPGIIAEFGLR